MACAIPSAGPSRRNLFNPCNRWNPLERFTPCNLCNLSPAIPKKQVEAL
jgi:hypothetical protein